MDAVRRAQQEFVDALEALLSLDGDEARAQALVDGAAAASAWLDTVGSSLLLNNASSPILGDGDGNLTGSLQKQSSEELSDNGKNVRAHRFPASEVLTVPFDGGTDATGNLTLTAEKSPSSKVDVASSKSWEIELSTWSQAVQLCWSSVVRDHLGVKVAKHLDLTAPNYCATWLDALKILGSCVVAAQNIILNQKLQGRTLVKVKVLHERADLEEGPLRAHVQLDEGEVLEESLGIWTTDSLLKVVWPELKDRGGLRCARWRARVAAGELVSSLAVHDLRIAKARETLLPVLEDLLQALIFGMALGDSQWQVRCAVVPAASKILKSSYGFLPDALWTSLTWGVLAVCVDPQPEVQAVATDSILQHLLPTSSQHTEGVVQDLLHRFITLAVAAAGSSENGFDRLKGGKAILAAVKAAVLLQLVPHQSAFEVQELGKLRIDRVPLLVVAASVALADADERGNKVLAASLLQLLRSLGSYHASLLAMLNPMMPLYECANLASYCKRRGVIDEDAATKLERVTTATTLKGLAVAFGALETTTTPSSLQNMRDLPSSMHDECIGNKQLDALQHITEVLHLPPEITRNYKEKATEAEVTNFLVCGNLHLRIALVLIRKQVWTPQQAWDRENLILDISLSFAALASGIIESESTWVDTEGLGKLSNNAIICLSEAVRKESGSRPDEDKLHVLSGTNGSGIRSVETLVLQLLPAILSRLKEILKAGTRFVNEENQTAAPKNDDLPGAIVSAHQLRWCLDQVQYPNLKPHSEMVIRTVLIALDHYSPSVKRQAMKAFIHLAKNLSPTELHWFKDAILEAVTRNLSGSEDLWPVAVEMAVAVVTRIEGRNPRGHWYGETMKAMIEDLERHRSDQGRRVVWLQTVTPQFEAMGIVLVAHFKGLLPLLYEWLRTPDEPTQLLVLANLCTIIKHTWPRIPFHASRIRDELTLAHKDAKKRNLSPEIFAAIDEVHRLLQLITAARVPERPTIASGLVKSR